MNSTKTTNRSNLFIVGTPLNEAGALSETVKNKISKAQVLIGESKKITYQYLIQCADYPAEKDIFFLDNIKPEELNDVKMRLRSLNGETAILISDSGMPILFDPGKEILEFCKELNFRIYSAPGPTSWGTACALSGYNPPFYIQGFLSQKADKRMLDLKILKTLKANIVLLDTPYRYHTLLTEIEEVFGKNHQVFLGWELGSKGEFLYWGTIEKLREKSRNREMKKGEFVLIVNQESRE